MTDDLDLRPYAYAEVAILAGVSVQTIRRRVKAGWLIRVPGSQGLLTRRSVHRWLNGVVGYDADSDGQGEGPGDGGPNHAITDRTAPLAGRGHDRQDRCRDREACAARARRTPPSEVIT